MADIIDDANDHVANLNEDALNAVRNKVPTEKHILSQEDLECVECAGQINPARAAKGYDTCIDCARMLERINKNYRRSHNNYEYDD